MLIQKGKKISNALAGAGAGVGAAGASGSVGAGLKPGGFGQYASGGLEQTP